MLYVLVPFFNISSAALRPPFSGFCLQNLFGARHLFCRWYGHIVKCIAQTQLFPFEHTQRVIRQHFHSLHIGERVDERPQPPELFLIIGKTRHQHMTYPYRHTKLREASGTVEDILIAVAGELAVSLGVDMLQV